MKPASEATFKLLALSMLTGVGPAALRKASRLPGVEGRSIEELGIEVAAIGRATARPGAWNEAQARADEQLELATRHGAFILSPLDAAYPALLAATKDDPFLLYVRGDLHHNPGRSVAIIGTREPTRHGEVITARLTRHFVERGWSIVSGLALGCDSIAHRVAVELGGHTVAVMAHGLQEVAPSRHKDLAEQILRQGGAIVSQYPFGRPAIPQQFVQRDRTQAGFARGVVMVQSDVDGGSLHASRAALHYGRWLAVPYPTEADRMANAAKVQANLLLAEGPLPARLNLLKQTSEEALERVLVLRGKEDYAHCLAMLEQPERPAASARESAEPSIG